LNQIKRDGDRVRWSQKKREVEREKERWRENLHGDEASVAAASRRCEAERSFVGCPRSNER